MVSILINNSLMYLSILTYAAMRNTKIELFNCNYKVDVVAFCLNTASDFVKSSFLSFLGHQTFLGSWRYINISGTLTFYPLKCKMSLADLYFTYPKRITFIKYNQSKRPCRFVIYLCSWLCSALKHCLNGNVLLHSMSHCESPCWNFNKFWLFLRRSENLAYHLQW